MRIGFFGGSFNPVHNGHLEIINNTLAANLVDEVLVVPCGNHAFGKDLLEGRARLDMINLAVSANPRVKVSDIEIRSSEKSYTATTLRKLKETTKDTYVIIIGADNVSSLIDWHDWQYLRDNFEFIVARRPGCTFENDDGLRIRYLVRMYNETSSSDIRNKLAKGASISGLVPEGVEDYILKNNLYRN